MSEISIVVPIINTSHETAIMECFYTQTFRDYDLIFLCNCECVAQSLSASIPEFISARVVYDSSFIMPIDCVIWASKFLNSKYISFFNPDDQISCDWLRSMTSCAENYDADLVISDYVLSIKDEKLYCPFDIIRNKCNIYSGSDVLQKLLHQRGAYPIWGCLWGKVFRTAVVQKAVSVFEKNLQLDYRCFSEIAITLFLVAYYTFCLNVVNAHNVIYFKRCDESKIDVDLDLVFDYLDTHFVDDMCGLISTDVDGVFLENISIYRDTYVASLIEKYGCGSHRVCDKIKSNGLLDKFSRERDVFRNNLVLFDESRFQLYEDIKRYISWSKCRYVSFDMFDTLVVRPFFKPTDLFLLLDSKYLELSGASSHILFSKIRIDAESSARALQFKTNPKEEDITIDDIYDYIGNNYCFSRDILDKLKDYEKELEIKYCTIRHTGKDLFELAQYCGKNVLVTSDMYLDTCTINSILDKCGYHDYELYLSSDIRLGKYSGNLFKYIADVLNIIDRDELCHIGDNWHSDVELPRRFGFVSFHLCRPIEMLQNANGGLPTGGLFNKLISNETIYVDSFQNFNQYLGLRCCWALVANRLFDNPYDQYVLGSEFNVSPLNLGYCAVGMHLLALTLWILDHNVPEGNTIHFVARDGYLLKKFYEMYVGPESSEHTNYLYISRNSLLTADILSSNDLYALYNKVNILNMSPVSLTELIKDIFIKSDYEVVLSHIITYYDRPYELFSSDDSFYKFIGFLVSNFSDKMDFESNHNRYYNVFSPILKKGDVIFDMGYSGRSESALSSIMGFAVNSLNVHLRTDVANLRSKLYDFSIDEFYGFKPIITGMMREHLLMELGPSTVGYEEGVPVFEEYSVDYLTKEITELVHEAALDFCKDYVCTFGIDRKYLFHKYWDLSLPFEHYLHNSEYVDRKIFESLIFEDTFGEGGCVKVIDFWSDDINYNVKKNRGSDKIVDGVSESNIIPSPQSGPCAVNKCSFVRRMYMFLKTVLYKINPSLLR